MSIRELTLTVLAFASGGLPVLAADERPNILWVTCEDICPNLGCYGDPYARTPTLDRLAAQGVRYTNAFGITGVCAPNRSCLISGVYPSTLGSHNMRCTTRLPDAIKCFSEYLRQARLLLHEQRQDRLQLRGAQDRLGRDQQPSPLAKAAAGPAVLQRVQLHGLPREPDPAERRQLCQEHGAADAGPAARPGGRLDPAVPSRHARGPPRLGPLPRLDHRHGLPGRRRTARSWTRTAWRTTRLSSSSATTARACRAARSGSGKPVCTSR